MCACTRWGRLAVVGYFWAVVALVGRGDGRTVEMPLEDSLHTMDSPTIDLSMSELIMDELVMRQNVDIPVGVTFPDDQSNTFANTNQDVFLLTDAGATRDSFVLFRPPEGQTIDDYTLSVSGNDTTILNEDDIESTVEQISNDPLIYNITSTLNFDKNVGVVAVDTVLAENGGQERSFNAEAIVLAAGIRVFRQGDPADVINDDIVDFETLGGENPTYGVRVFTPERQNNLDGPVDLDPLSLSVSDPNAVVTYDEPPCTPTDGTWTGDEVQFVDGCGITITNNFVQSGGQQEWQGGFLGFNLNENRQGTVDVTFDYPAFGGQGLTEDGEPVDYATEFTLTVVGEAPVTVTAVEPAGPFAVGGGDTVTMTIFNGPDLAGESDEGVFDLSLRSSGEQFEYIVGSYTGEGEAEQTIQFRMPPYPGGDASLLAWDLTVTPPGGETEPTRDETEDYTFSYFAIERLQPQEAVFVQDNPPIINIRGWFPGVEFGPNRGDQVTLGDTVISDPVVVDDATIQFPLPARPSSDLSYPVQVRSQGLLTNTRTFTYVAQPTVNIVPIGGVETSGQNAEVRSFDISQSSDTTFVAQVTGASVDGGSFTWNLQDADGNAGSDIPSQQTVTIPASEFQDSTLYTLGVSFISALDREDSTEIELQPINGFRAGGSINQPATADRTAGEFQFVSLNVNEINQQQAEDYQYTYNWDYQGQSFEWTQDSGSNNPDATDLNKLGRSFKVLNADLEPGQTEDIEVTTTVTAPDGSTQTSTSTTQLTVQQRQVFAVVGTGATGVILNGDEDFTFTAENSVDNSIIPADNVPLNDGISYLWIRAQRSLTQDFRGEFTDVTSEVIGDNRNEASFTVPSSTWESILGDESEVFIRMILTVTKGEAESTSALVYTVRQAGGPSFARVDGFQFTNLQGDSVVSRQTNYLDSLVIEPFINGDSPSGLSYSYTVSPDLIAEDAFIDQAGSYQLPNQDGGGANGVAVRSGSMEPNTQYTMDVDVSADDLDPTSYRVRWTTVEAPQFTLDVNVQDGDETTPITAVVTSNVNSSRFQTYFRLFDSDDIDFESPLLCMGGCNGENIVSTFICASGNYRIQAQIVDPTGSIVYGSADGPPRSRAPISIDVSVADQEYLDYVNAELARCSASGDDACLTMLYYCLSTVSPSTTTQSFARSLAQNETSLNTVALRQEESRVQTIRDNTDEIERLSEASVLSSYEIQSIMTSLASFAGGREQNIQDADTVTSMMQSVENIYSRANPQTNFSPVSSSTLNFLYDIGDVSVNVGAPATSRRRLLQGGDGVNNLVLDTDIVGTDVAPLLGLSGGGCGLETTLTTQYEGSAESDYGDSTFTCRIVCNSDQLEEALSAGEFGALSVCSEFAEFNVQLGICLEAMPDIVSLSNVATEGFTNTPQLLKIVPVGSDAAERDIPDGCFSVTNAIVQTEDGEAFNAAQPRAYTPQVEYPADVAQGEAYVPTDIGDQIDCPDGNPDGCSIYEGFTINTSDFEIYGAGGIIIPTPTPAAGLSGGAIAGIVIGVLLLLLLVLLICIIYFLLVPPVYDEDEEPAVEYLERDIYGRGFVIEDTEYLDDDEGYAEDEGGTTNVDTVPPPQL